MTIAAEEFNTLLTPFQVRGSMAVAVSGGLDSLCLLLLMKEWAHARSIPLFALTVDHQLRSESLQEAQQVSRWCKLQNIPHALLTWDHEAVNTACQEKARHARYDLMLRWCQENEVQTLLTAHHGNDQWETFFMRLARGSGVQGLCGIRPVLHRKGIQIIRPLLNFSKETLKETLEKRFHHPWMEDPTNQNLKYERTRWRSLQGEIPIPIKMISQTTSQLQEFQDFLGQQVALHSPQCFCEGKVNRELFQTFHPVLAKALLSSWIQEITGNPYPPSPGVLHSLYQKILSPHFKGATAGGCVFLYRSKSQILIIKENRN